MSNEFKHYAGCKYKDPENCSGCALTQGGVKGPNYAAWPLSYAENNRSIPSKWKKALLKEVNSNNKAYAKNIIKTIFLYKTLFTDGQSCYNYLVEKMDDSLKTSLLT